MTAPRNILLAYDGSSGAKMALEDLKRNRAGLPIEAGVLVLCVAEVWGAANPPDFGAYGLAEWPVTEAQLEALQVAERVALKQARRIAMEASKALQADQPGWAIRAESCTGASAWSIVKRAEDWRADLIVIGSHGRSALSRVILGSVSHAVIREAPCAVRVVRGRIGTREAPSRLLIGFDGSVDAEAAVAAVAERMWPSGSAARLLTAMDGRLSTAVPVTRRAGARGRDEAPWMRRMMDDPTGRLREAGLAVSSVVKMGDPRTLLVEEAKQWGADGLFVGARGLRGVKRFLLGSVSTAVAMRAPCPVEVVRPARVEASRQAARPRTQAPESLVQANR